MSANVIYNGTTYSIPDPGDEGWGASLTAFLTDVANSRPAATTMPSAIDVNKMSLVPTSSTVTADSTLTAVTSHHKLTAASALTLNATTSITDGTTDGQFLVLQGTSDTNTVTIQDASNVELNGDIVLGSGDLIALLYNSTAGVWRELYRSN